MADRLFDLLFRTPLKPYMASQLARPRGLFGRWAASVMNRSNAALSLWALEALELDGTEQVLELGFGGGPALGELLKRARRVEGLDVSRDMVMLGLARWRDAVDRGRLGLGQGDLMDLPYAASSFHAALSVNTVYFWPDPPRAAAELFRVLKPGGRLSLGLRPGDLVRQRGLTRHGFRAWDKDPLAGLLRGAGFAGVRVDEGTVKGAPSWRAVGHKP